MAFLFSIPDLASRAVSRAVRAVQQVVLGVKFDGHYKSLSQRDSTHRLARVLARDREWHRVPNFPLYILSLIYSWHGRHAINPIEEAATVEIVNGRIDGIACHACRVSQSHFQFVSASALTAGGDQ